MHSPPVSAGPLLGLVLVADPVPLVDPEPNPSVGEPPVSKGPLLLLLSVGVASAVLGIVMPSGLSPLSTQYCTWMLLRIATSVAVFISANVHDVDAHRSSELALLSRLPFLHQQPELSQP